MKSHLEVRWELSPENVDNGGNANQPFWPQVYCNLKLACKRVPRMYDLNHKPHQYQVLIWWFIE